MKAHSRQCDTAVAPMEICSSNRCAVTQHKWSAALFRAKCNPHCSVLLCNEGSQQAVWHCSYTYGDLLFMQVCSDLAQMQCSVCSGQNAIPTVRCCSAMKAQSRQCVTAVTPMEICSSNRCAVTQHRWSAALFRARCNPHCSVLLCSEGSQQAVWHCSCTYGDLLFIQVCSDPAQMQCSSDQGKMQSTLFIAGLDNRLWKTGVALQLPLWRFALQTGVQ